MENLTFGEQVKIILGRKGMTIKELAELIQERTGMKMSRQNLTQRLGRDNFQEQDMRMIASILQCPFELNILPSSSFEIEKVKQKRKTVLPREPKQETENISNVEQFPAASIQSEESQAEEVDMTIGEIYDIHQELKEAEEQAEAGEPVEAVPMEIKRSPAAPELTGDFEPVIQYDDIDDDPILGEINPYTGKEYQTNSVRMHPNRIGYVQVYDRSNHKWTDMTEWAFLGYQERKKALLGKEYDPPIYLD